MTRTLWIFFFLMFSSARAEVTPLKLLSFKDWKSEQVVNAKNSVVRLSNRITLYKKGVLIPSTEADAAVESLETQSDRKTNKALAQSEEQLKLALESLQFATELSMEDYFAVYLSRYKEEPGALEQVAAQMSKEEVAELLKILMSKNQLPGSAARDQDLPGRRSWADKLSAKTL